MAKRGRRPQQELELQSAQVLNWQAEGYTQAAIAEMLDCHVRTVQRIVRASRPVDPTPLWSAFDPEIDAEDAALALPALASILERSGGRKSKFTQAEIAAVLRVRRLAPDLPARHVWSVAVGQRRAAASGREAERESLLAFFAFQPWASPAARDRFLRWVIDNRPGWLLERETVGAGEIRPGPPVKLTLRGLTIDPAAVAPGVRKAAEILPSGVRLRPLAHGAPIPADPVGAVAGVIIALEIGRDNADASA